MEPNVQKDLSVCFNVLLAVVVQKNNVQSYLSGPLVFLREIPGEQLYAGFGKRSHFAYKSTLSVSLGLWVYYTNKMQLFRKEKYPFIYVTCL